MSGLPASRTGAPAGDAPPAPAPLTTAAEVEELLAALPRHSPELRLEVETLDLLRVLTLADPETTVDRLVVTVSAWERPLDTWVGRLGRVVHVQSCTVDYPTVEPPAPTRWAELAPRVDLSEPADHPVDLLVPATVDLRLSRPTPLADVARGAYPLLGVDRRQHGHGFVELGTVGVGAAALALLPNRTAPGTPGPPSVHLEGAGLSHADLGLVGTQAAFDELLAERDPARTLVEHPLLVDPSGHLALTERVELPLVDLNLHNPIGRRHILELSRWTYALTSPDGELTFRPVPTGATEPTWPPARNRVRDRTEKPAQWSRPATAVLSGREVRQVREVEAIDLSGLQAADRDAELVLYRRLAELAATGSILHSLPASFTGADDVLGPTLAGLLRRPYRPTTGLVRDLRSVPQRREAMQRFGGFLELAAHAATLGHRLLPTVSVVLSTMRPSRVVDVLLALAAQRYPHLEIAVAVHGATEPVGAAFEDAVRVSGASVFRHDRSTPFGSVLADLARHTTGDLVVKIDDDDVYGPRVVEDLVLAHLYSNADVVGKTTEYLYLEDIDHTAHRTFATECYHTQVAGGAMMLSRAMLNEIGGWRPSPHSTDRSILIRVGHAGGIGYRTNSLGYVYVRHSEGHTWKQADSLLLRNTPEQWPRFMPEIIEA
ncbi:glycosyltransferase [Nocardioides dongxiaopingii]|uniref:glycosyltransferase n=1 Tax=Nocardioides dongxiaopingii TaxID=2576036 RepID=UPI0010C76A2F|nr:glycosyltransferase [Nocardioides dongxiaopingii]